MFAEAKKYKVPAVLFNGIREVDRTEEEGDWAKKARASWKNEAAAERVSEGRSHAGGSTDQGEASARKQAMAHSADTHGKVYLYHTPNAAESISTSGD